MGEKLYHKIIIPIQPITKKNHQQILKNWKTGKPFISQSKQYKEYEEKSRYFLKKLQIDKPVNIKAVYYMQSRRRVDLINLHSALHDVLVKHGTLIDDNVKIIVSTDGSKVMYDKENPRTEVTISEI